MSTSASLPADPSSHHENKGLILKLTTKMTLRIIAIGGRAVLLPRHLCFIKTVLHVLSTGKSHQLLKEWKYGVMVPTATSTLRKWEG